MKDGNLKDLRTSFLIVLIPFILILLSVFGLSPILINWLTDYYGLNLVTLGITESFGVQFKISMIIALISLLPLITYAIYRFIKPAYELKSQIKRIILAEVLALEGFILGATYFSKVIMNNLNSYSLVEGYYSLNNVLTFGIGIGFAVAVSLQLMLLIPLLNQYKIIKYESVGKTMIPFIIVSYFISAFITPPDLVSTFMVMLPLNISCLIGLSISKVNNYSFQKNECEKIKCLA